MPKSNVCGFVLVLFICGAIVPQAAFLNVSSYLPTGHHSDMDNPPRSEAQQVQNLQSQVTGPTTLESSAEPLGLPQPPDYFSSQEGVIDPRLITQSGTYVREWEDLHTDANQNASVSLDLDRGHNWVGQKMDVEISDLQRQFIANGTFDEGINGTNVNGEGDAHPFGWLEEIQPAGWYQTQRTSYLNDSQCVVVENEGRNIGNFYRHYANTIVRWNQTIAVERYTEQFTLQFNLLYDRGPLYNYFYTQAVYVAVWFNDIRVWRYDLVYLSQRDTWYRISSIGIEFPIVGSLNFQIGIYYRSTTDFDPNNYACGSEENARFVTLFLDNVTLTPTYPPYPSEVSLQVHNTETGQYNITDTSRGNGVQTLFYEYWVNDQIHLEFSSNSSIYFTCRITLLALNFRNSTITSNFDNEGVKYEANTDSSMNLTLWTVVAYPSSYTNFWFNVTFPTDWENITIFDSFPSDVTSQCYFDVGVLKVNGSIAAQLGWWQIEFQAPNYLKFLAAQVFNSTTNDWENEDTFRCNNETRVIGDIGSDSSVPSPLVDINATWVLPNGSLWSQTIFDGLADGSFTSPSRWLEGTNSSAGRWTVVLFWTNGSEIAFHTIEFTVIHGAKLSPHTLIIEAQPGYSIVGMVYYVDAETNKFILDETAVLVANWSLLDIPFIPNPVNQWWEGEFDTNIVDPGTYLVKVNASQPFYDDASCTFAVEVLFTTRLTSPNAPWDTAKWGENKSLTLHYEFFNTTTEPPHSWEGIINSTPPTKIWCNWSAGHWSLQETGVLGEYLLIIDTSALTMETWSLNITAVKDGYRSRQLTIDLLVAERLSMLTIVGNKSAEISVHENITLILSYNREDGQPINGATITVDEITPETGVSWDLAIEWEDVLGYYNITFTPYQTGSWTIRISANKTNFTPALLIFQLTVTKTPTFLKANPPPPAIPYGYVLKISVMYCYRDNHTLGIDEATCEITGLSPSEWNISFVSNGNYTIQIANLSRGQYSVTLRFSREWYEEATLGFLLEVITHPTIIEHLPLPQTVFVQRNTTFSLWYNSSFSGEGLSDAYCYAEGLSEGEWSYIDYQTGQYSFTIFPLTTGNRSIVIIFSKIGYQEGAMEYYKYHPLEVICIPLQIHWHQSSFYSTELVDFPFSLNLVESDTQRLVRGITIHFDFLTVRTSMQQESVVNGDLKELTNGTYEATVNLPLGTYILRVAVSGPEYYSEVIENNDVIVVVQQNTLLRQGQYIGIFFVILLLAISGYVSSRELRKRRGLSQRRMLAARQEFEDARNIVAIVITYKRSGTPIFTTQIGETIRGDLLAGFLTAISHLRKEIINHESSEESMGLIPLSDVMFISPTQTTYCALITLMPPSQRLQDKLVEFSQIVLHQYDNLLHQRESHSIERVIPTTIAEVVNKVFGLRHLAPHISTFDGRPPWKFRYLARVIKEFFPTGKNIDLIALSRHMQHQGMREKRAYYIIQQAIKEGYLVALPIFERILDHQLPKSSSRSIEREASEEERYSRSKHRTRKKVNS